QLHDVAAEGLCRDADGSGAAGNVALRLAFALMGVDGVEVVLTDVEDRQMLEGGEVHAFVEDAFFSRAIAEEADDDAGALPVLLGIGVAGGVPDAGADDG